MHPLTAREYVALQILTAWIADGGSDDHDPARAFEQAEHFLAESRRLAGEVKPDEARRKIAQLVHFLAHQLQGEVSTGDYTTTARGMAKTIQEKIREAFDIADMNAWRDLVGLPKR